MALRRTLLMLPIAAGADRFHHGPRPGQTVVTRNRSDFFLSRGSNSCWYATVDELHLKCSASFAICDSRGNHVQLGNGLTNWWLSLWEAHPFIDA